MLQRPCILIVEDEPLIQEAVVVILSEEGYEVLSAENGKVALELLETRKEALPILILLDLNMPVMSGEEFLRVQKADPILKNISTVVFTASGRKEKPELSDGIVRKPINLDDLLVLVSGYARPQGGDIPVESVALSKTKTLPSVSSPN
jgi:CheY-like chemotaxis protein